MPTTLLPLVDDMVSAMRAGNDAEFYTRFNILWTAAQTSRPDELTAAVEQLVPLIGGLYGVFAKVAVLAGAMVERGASPMPLCDVLPERAAGLRNPRKQSCCLQVGSV